MLRSTMTSFCLICVMSSSAFAAGGKNYTNVSDNTINVDATIKARDNDIRAENGGANNIKIAPIVADNNNQFDNIIIIERNDIRGKLDVEFDDNDVNATWFGVNNFCASNGICTSNN